MNGCSPDVPPEALASRLQYRLSGAEAPPVSSVYAGQRRRTGIEPAGDATRRPPVLKTGGATRHPDASGADVTRAGPLPAIRPPAHARAKSWLPLNQPGGHQTRRCP